MKIVKSLIRESPVAALRFDKRNDFDKFFKFIKVETKKLKKEDLPSGKGIKKILPAIAAGGIGALGIGLLFGQRGKGEKEDKELQLAGRFSPARKDFVNQPSPLPLTLQFGNIQSTQTQRSRIKRKRPFFRSKKIVDPKRFGKDKFNPFKLRRRGVTRDFATRIQEAKTDPTKAKSLRKINPSRSRVTFSQNVDANLIKAEKEIVKKFFTNQDSLVKKNAKLGDDFLKKLNEAIGKDNPLFQGDTVDDTLKKLGRSVDGVSKFEDGFDVSKFFSTKGKKSGFDLLMDRIKGTSADDIDDIIRDARRGKIVIPEPMSRVGTTSSAANPGSVISQNPLQNQGRGGLARFFKRTFGSNVKLTKQNPLTGFRKIIPTGIGTKLGMFASNPIVKAGFFFLDLYNAVQSGKNVFNLKDNLVTSLIDLGIAINNTINADDPSKLKLFIGESSDQKRRLFQIKRNRKILQLKNSVDTKSNDLVLLPMNLGDQQQGGPLNIPNPTSDSTPSVAFNTDQLNIGDIVFLSKLSAG